MLLKCQDINKTCVIHGIHAEHLQHYDKHIVPLLAMCINIFYLDFYLLLCYVLCVVLVHIIKDKCGKINSKK